MKLPVQLGPASTWSLADFGRKWVQGTAAAGGGGLVSVKVADVPQDELWLIDFIRVSAETGDVAVRAFLCMDTPDFDIMGTYTGEYDTADQNSAIQAPGGSEVLLVWRDMPDGATCRGYVQWAVMRQAVSA